MKKFALAAATAVLATTAVAPAVAGPTEFRLKSTVASSKAGTKTGPKPVTLTTLITSGPPGEYAAASALVSLDKHFKFNTTKFATCTETQVFDGKCGAKAKVGSGTATAVVAAANNVASNLTVTAFNGKNNTLYILLDTKNPIPVRGVMVGKLKNATGKFGKKLDVTIPQSLQSVSGFTPTLTSFRLKIGAVSKGVPYIQSTGCSAGKWNFAAVVNYNDGTKGEGTSSAKCKAG